MLGIRFVCEGVGECQSEDPFVCSGAKPPQRACARDLPRDQERTRDGKVQELKRRVQLRAEETSQQKITEEGREETSRQNRAVGRREQELRPVDPEAASANVKK